MAIEAALQAEQRHMEVQADQRRIGELELQQARYEASLAERRYAACDPDNRLIAAQLEKSWEAALQRVRLCEQRLDATVRSLSAAPNPDLGGLAQDLSTAWDAPGVTMRARQQLLRALVKDIIADVDEETREIVLTIHWQGGQHSQLRIAKPRSGEHGCRTPDEALAVMRSMAGKWSDEHIAATLNRMGLPTGQGKTWTAHRVGSVRMVNDIRAYRSAHKDGEWLTMSEAAAKLGVTNHRIRHLIKEGLLPARASCAARAVSDSGERSAGSEGHRGDHPNRSPVSRRFQEPDLNVFKHLTKWGTMNKPLPKAGFGSRRSYCVCLAKARLIRR